MPDKRFVTTTTRGDFMLRQIVIEQLDNGWTIYLDYRGMQSADSERTDKKYCETLIDVINYMINTFNIKFKVVADNDVGS